MTKKKRESVSDQSLTGISEVPYLTGTHDSIPEMGDSKKMAAEENLGQIIPTSPGDALKDQGDEQVAVGSAEDDPFSWIDPEHILTSYVRRQIQVSPLTPAEIAERSGTSVSQIYRFLKGERSLTLESADKVIPIIARSLIESIRGNELGAPSSADSYEEVVEDEKDRLRRRLEAWENGAYQGAKEILVEVSLLADRIRYVIDGL